MIRARSLCSPVAGVDSHDENDSVDVATFASNVLTPCGGRLRKRSALV